MIDVTAYARFNPTSVEHYVDEYDGTDSVEMIFATEDQAKAARDYCFAEGKWGWARIGNVVYLHDLSKVESDAPEPVHTVYVDEQAARYMTTESFDTDLPNWFERYPSDQWVRWIEVGVDWVWFVAYKRRKNGRPDYGTQHEVSVHIDASVRNNHVTWIVQV